MSERDAQPSASGQPAVDDKSPTVVTLDLSTVIEHCRCPICMGIVRNTRAVSACMHRFCKDCIEAWLRTQIENNCPQCRVKFASKRDCKPDPVFDQLVGTLFGDIERFEADALEPSPAALERAREVGAGIAQAKEAAAAAARARPRPAPPAPAAWGPGAGVDAVVRVTAAARGDPRRPPKRAPPAPTGSEPKRARSGGGLSVSPAGSGLSPTGNSAGIFPDGRLPDRFSPNFEFRGVRRAGTGNWHAKTKRANREVLLGTFATAHEAARCYDVDRLLQQARRVLRLCCGNKAQRLNFPNLREVYKQIIAESDASAPDFLAKAVAAATAASQKMGAAALVRTVLGRGGGGRARAPSSAPRSLLGGDSEEDEEAGAEGEESDDASMVESEEAESEQEEKAPEEDSEPDYAPPQPRRRSRVNGTAAAAQRVEREERAAAAAERAMAAAAAAAAAAEGVRARAAELAAQHPLSAAFAGAPAVALVRLECGALGGSGGVAWRMRHLAVPAAASVAQLKAGLGQQLGRRLAPAALGLVLQNDLDSSVDFAALCTEDAATGALLLRDGVTVRRGGWGAGARPRKGYAGAPDAARHWLRRRAAPRHRRRPEPSRHAQRSPPGPLLARRPRRRALLASLEDCTEGIVLEYHVRAAAPQPGAEQAADRAAAEQAVDRRHAEQQQRPPQATAERAALAGACSAKAAAGGAAAAEVEEGSSPSAGTVAPPAPPPAVKTEAPPPVAVGAA
eukprot:scaffold23.g4117.t1